ncbi:hypothetical protein DPMN_145667 [Dreissena polymorpha]|uniref:Oxidoreductase FAD/NAD(P)-binding domain-containing protein n=2 Tax=Dreissena polymorpha TaxID=45954 RepID=A0A9D4F8W4_DREPO|nr:hypothetical protein DPMN_145667 [Dreissena polymorpha]
MIGPGTGIAPFRSFIEERAVNKKGASTLFFGCRSSSNDFYFETQWKDMVARQLLTLHTAFSRDNQDGSKYYVQHAIRDAGSEVWRLLQSGAVVCVAGNSKNMPDSVREAIKEVGKVHGGLSDSAANDFLLMLDKEKRYQAETWS